MTETRPKYGAGSLSQRARDREEELLTPAAVAKLHGCSRNTVHQAILNGELVALPVLGPDGEASTYAVRRADAQAWKARKPGRPARAARSSG